MGDLLFQFYKVLLLFFDCVLMSEIEEFLVVDLLSHVDYSLFLFYNLRIFGRVLLDKFDFWRPFRGNSVGYASILQEKLTKGK